MSLVDVPTAKLLTYVKTNRPDDDLTSDISDAIKVAESEKEWAMGLWTLEDEIAHVKHLSRKEGLAEGRAEGEAAAIDALKKLIDSGMTFDEAVKQFEKH